MQYPELIQLKAFLDTYTIKVTRIDIPPIAQSLTPVEVSFHNETFIVQIQDEYDDLKHQNPLLDGLLVLRELAIIQDSTDFVSWCKSIALSLDNNHLLSYYKQTTNTLHKISQVLKNKDIDYFVSDLDFQLNSGPIQQLRSNNP